VSRRNKAVRIMSISKRCNQYEIQPVHTTADSVSGHLDIITEGGAQGGGLVPCIVEGEQEGMSTFPSIYFTRFLYYM